jgi:hypothetical protein
MKRQIMGREVVEAVTKAPALSGPLVQPFTGPRLTLPN